MLAKTSSIGRDSRKHPRHLRGLPTTSSSRMGSRNGRQWPLHGRNRALNMWCLPMTRSRPTLTCARLMGLNPMAVRHLREASYFLETDGFDGYSNSPHTSASICTPGARVTGFRENVPLVQAHQYAPLHWIRRVLRPQHDSRTPLQSAVFSSVMSWPGGSLPRSNIDPVMLQVSTWLRNAEAADH